MSKNTAVEWLVKELRNHIAEGTLDAIAISKLKMQAKAMEREQIDAALPSKDDAVNVGFRKAINADYNLRKVCKDSDEDLYYSGWMDCYDWLNETYKGGEE
jgi:CRISPR/Cas system-associated protein Csm6